MSIKEAGTKLLIDRLTESDLDRLLEIERACYIDPWGVEMFESEVARRSYNCPMAGRIRPRKGAGRGADDEEPGIPSGRLAGFVIAHLLVAETHILNIAVDPAYQGKGYGRSLLGAVLNYAAERGEERAVLEVRESNLKAQCLYLSAGFRVIGRRKNYYDRQKEDALVMLLHPLRPVYPRTYRIVEDPTPGRGL